MCMVNFLFSIVLHLRSPSLIVPFFLLVSFYSFSQNNNDKFIEGIVYNDNSYSIEGVHVLNITSNEATITNSEGNFKILVKLNDELIFSAIQFKRKKITMNQDIFDSLSITVYLEEFVNELDEVILNSSGLSGSLMNDLQNTGIVKDLNFLPVVKNGQCIKIVLKPKLIF